MQSEDEVRSHAWPSSQLTRIDAACDRFEAAWEAGGEPEVEDFLRDVPETLRAQLRRELMAIAAERRATEVKHIDPALAQFRAAWESGTRPQIEEFLTDVPSAVRAEVLVRLLAEEVASRIRIGETPTAREYEQRFPADAETVRQALSRATPFPAKRSEQNTHSHRQAVVAQTETQAWEGSSATPTSEPNRPGHIGRYKVVGILGSGGFGTVYRARDEQLERDVAIKVWRRDRFAADEAVEHLVQEARHVARLDEHPSIVEVHDVGCQEDGSAFVVFQYIEGHSLADELRSHPLPPDRVWEVMIQVTSAI